MQKEIKIFGGLALIIFASACSAMEPLDGSVTSASKGTASAAKTDERVIANEVGHANVGTMSLAWANASTGSAGVIERIDAEAGSSKCRTFVSTRQTLAGSSRFAGLACPADNASWKLNKAPQ